MSRTTTTTYGAERLDSLTTLSGEEVRPLHTPADVPPFEEIGLPGEFPFAAPRFSRPRTEGGRMSIGRVAVLGGGLMSSGIAEATAVAGLEVVVREVDPPALEALRDARVSDDHAPAALV
jgi:NADPH-dependent 2,4-dienoyl-CoA reductase/sulfur reductase-like enzyme